MSVAPFKLCALLLITALTVSYCDESPDGYTVSELRALPEAGIADQDSTVIERSDNPGKTLRGPTSTNIVTLIGSQSTADEVFDHFQSELVGRGWVGGRELTSIDFVLAAHWRKGDFRFVLWVLDKAKTRDVSPWDRWPTVYQVTIGAVGVKGE